MGMHEQMSREQQQSGDQTRNQKPPQTTREGNHHSQIPHPSIHRNGLLKREKRFISQSAREPIDRNPTRTTYLSNGSAKTNTMNDKPPSIHTTLLSPAHINGSATEMVFLQTNNVQIQPEPTLHWLRTSFSPITEYASPCSLSPCDDQSIRRSEPSPADLVTSTQAWTTSSIPVVCVATDHLVHKPNQCFDSPRFIHHELPADLVDEQENTELVPSSSSPTLTTEYDASQVSVEDSTLVSTKWDCQMAMNVNQISLLDIRQHSNTSSTMYDTNAPSMQFKYPLEIVKQSAPEHHQSLTALPDGPPSADIWFNKSSAPSSAVSGYSYRSPSDVDHVVTTRATLSAPNSPLISRPSRLRSILKITPSPPSTSLERPTGFIETIASEANRNKAALRSRLLKDSLDVTLGRMRHLGNGTVSTTGSDSGCSGSPRSPKKSVRFAESNRITEAAVLAATTTLDVNQTGSGLRYDSTLPSSGGTYQTGDVVNAGDLNHPIETSQINNTRSNSTIDRAITPLPDIPFQPIMGDIKYPPTIRNRATPSIQPSLVRTIDEEHCFEDLKSQISHSNPNSVKLRCVNKPPKPSCPLRSDRSGYAEMAQQARSKCPPESDSYVFTNQRSIWAPSINAHLLPTVLANTQGSRKKLPPGKTNHNENGSNSAPHSWDLQLDACNGQKNGSARVMNTERLDEFARTLSGCLRASDGDVPSSIQCDGNNVALKTIDMGMHQRPVPFITCIKSANYEISPTVVTTLPEYEGVDPKLVQHVQRTNKRLKEQDSFRKDVDEPDRNDQSSPDSCFSPTSDDIFDQQTQPVGDGSGTNMTIRWTNSRDVFLGQNTVRSESSAPARLHGPPQHQLLPDRRSDSANGDSVTFSTPDRLNPWSDNLTPRLLQRRQQISQTGIYKLPPRPPEFKFPIGRQEERNPPANCTQSSSSPASAEAWNRGTQPSTHTSHRSILMGSSRPIPCTTTNKTSEPTIHALSERSSRMHHHTLCQPVDSHTKQQYQKQPPTPPRSMLIHGITSKVIPKSRSISPIHHQKSQQKQHHQQTNRAIRFEVSNGGGGGSGGGVLPDFGRPKLSDSMREFLDSERACYRSETECSNDSPARLRGQVRFQQKDITDMPLDRG